MGVAWYNPQSERRNPERVQRRKHARIPLNQRALMRAADGGSLLGNCTLMDISVGGARLKVERPAELPEFFVLVLASGARITRHCQIRWRSETEIGVQFQRT